MLHAHTLVHHATSLASRLQQQQHDASATFRFGFWILVVIRVQCSNCVCRENCPLETNFQDVWIHLSLGEHLLDSLDS